MTRYRILTFVLILSLLFILLSLGTWQKQRLVWKRDLIALHEVRMLQLPIDIPSVSEWKTMSKRDDEFRLIEVEGEFLHEQEVYWFTHRPREGSGVEVITPFRFEKAKGFGDYVVLVNRGFLPNSKKNPQMREAQQIKGKVRLKARIHFPAERHYFDPPDDIENRLWFVRDLSSMANYMGLSVAPFFINVESGENRSGIAFGKHQKNYLTNRHFEYMVTWYSLAVVLFVIFIIGYYRNHRQQRHNKG